MPIQTKCPGCGQAYNVSEKLAGQRTRCKQCGGVVTIPGGSAPNATPQALPATQPPATAPPSAAPPTAAPPTAAPPSAAPPNGTPAPAGLQNAALFAGAKHKRSFRLPKPAWYAIGGLAALVLLGVVVGLVLRLTGAGEAKLAAEPESAETPKGPSSDILPALPEGKKPRIAIKVSSTSVDKLKYSTTTSPCAVLDKQLWNLEQGSVCLNLNELIQDSRFTFAASPDGALFALCEKSRPNVEIWSVATGESVRVLEPDSDQFKPLTIGFRGKDELVVIWKNTSVVSPSRAISYQIATGKQTGLITVRLEVASISPSGDLFVCKSPDGFRIGDFRKDGPTTKKLSGPHSSWFLAPGRLPFISPDGKFAFGCKVSEDSTFLLWDISTGEVIYSRRAPQMLLGQMSELVTWLPDSSAVFVDGMLLIDRNSGRLLWQIKDKGVSGLRGAGVSRSDEVLCSIRDRRGQKWLASVAIPWDKINAATAAVHSDRAIFNPDQPVDLQIAVGSEFGDLQEARRQVGDMVAKRLMQSGISVKAGAKLRMSVSLSQRQGGTLKAPEPIGFGLDGPQRRTAPIVERPRSWLEVLLKHGESGDVLWRYDISFAGDSVGSGGLSDDEPQMPMLKQIMFGLAFMPTPYFAAANGKRLPIVSRIGDARGVQTKPAATTGVTPAPGAPAKSEVVGLPPAPHADVSSFRSPQIEKKPDPYRQPLFPKGFEPKVVIGLPTDTLLYPAANCNVVMCGGEVWDIRAGRQLAKFTRKLPYYSSSINLDYALRDCCHLSPDGEFLVVRTKSNTLQPPLEVWSARRGDVAHTFNGDTHAHAYWGAFRNNTELVLVTEDWDRGVKAEARIFNVETGEITRVIHLPDLPNPRKAEGAVSPDGARIAIAQGGVRQIDLNSGSGATRYFNPALDASGYHVVIGGLAYSPSGDRLAGVALEGFKIRLLLWDSQTGKLLSDRLCLVEPDSVAVDRFEKHPGLLVRWLPDGSSVLIAGCALVDVASGRVVWICNETRPPGGPPPQPVGVLDSHHLLVAINDANSGNWLLSVPIPWDAIRSGARAATDVSSPLRPGGKASIELALGSTSATDKTGRNVIGEAVATQLAQDGVEIAANQPVRFFVRLAPDTTQRDSAPGPDGVEQKRAMYEIGWRRADGEVLWSRKKFGVFAGFLDADAGNDGISPSINVMSRWLVQSPWPYALGGNALKGAGVLPVISDGPKTVDNLRIPSRPRGSGDTSDAVRAPRR